MDDIEVLDRDHICDFCVHVDIFNAKFIKSLKIHLRLNLSDVISYHHILQTSCVKALLYIAFHIWLTKYNYSTLFFMIIKIIISNEVDLINLIEYMYVPFSSYKLHHIDCVLVFAKV